VQSAPVLVAGPRGRSMLLRGPRFVRVGHVYLYRVVAPGGGTGGSVVRWRLDGVELRGSGARRLLRFLRPGRHSIRVEADEGHGVASFASRAVVAR
jgi:hypothetical protein